MEKGGNNTGLNNRDAIKESGVKNRQPFFIIIRRLVYIWLKNSFLCFLKTYNVFNSKRYDKQTLQFITSRFIRKLEV